MFTKREIFSILGVTIIIALSLSFLKGLSVFPTILLAIFLVILINVFTKKITAFYMDAEIETGLWKIKRYGFKPERHFNRPFPAGVLFPLLTSILTLGNFVWLGDLVFDVKPKVYRAAKRQGLYKFSEITEDHIGLIAAMGVFANLLFAVIGYFAGFSEFARLNVYFAFFNLIPLSNLDGNKIFFGNTVLWSFLAAVALILTGLALFIV